MKPSLSPKDLADAVAVSESTIKRWVDNGRIAAEKTPGGHRKILLSGAIQFIREQRIPVERGLPLGFPDIDTLSEPERGTDDSEERLYGFLSRGEADKSRGYIYCLYMRGHGIAEICDGPVKNAMTRIGELWKTDPAGICVEHIATNICIQAFHAIRVSLPVNEGAPAAVGGAPPGDPYQLPSLMADCVLASLGYRSYNLGPQTPFETFGIAIEKFRPKLVWISVGAGAGKNRLRKGIQRLAETAGAAGTRVIAGGGELGSLGALRIPNLYTGSTMAELTAFASGLLDGG